MVLSSFQYEPSIAALAGAVILTVAGWVAFRRSWARSVILNAIVGAVTFGGAVALGSGDLGALLSAAAAVIGGVVGAFGGFFAALLADRSEARTGPQSSGPPGAEPSDTE